jgi:membrane-associated phospholipid phosphatase
MRVFFLLLPAALAALIALPAVADGGYTKHEAAADVVTALLPLTAYGIAHFRDDGEGEFQLLRSVGVSLVLTTVLRGAFNETRWGERPNGHEYGFPSGHVAFATSSAAFLQDRYGWKYGVPAYALVGYIAWVRVDTDHHRWRDVIAGAALSYGVSRLFVVDQRATRIAPIIGPDWLGLRIERSF